MTWATCPTCGTEHCPEAPGGRHLCPTCDGERLRAAWADRERARRGRAVAPGVAEVGEGFRAHMARILEEN